MKNVLADPHQTCSI